MIRANRFARIALRIARATKGNHPFRLLRKENLVFTQIPLSGGHEIGIASWPSSQHIFPVLALPRTVTPAQHINFGHSLVPHPPPPLSGPIRANR